MYMFDLYILCEHLLWHLMCVDIPVKLLQDDAHSTASEQGKREPEAWNDQIGHNDQIQHVFTLATLSLQPFLGFAPFSFHSHYSMLKEEQGLDDDGDDDFWMH